MQLVTKNGKKQQCGEIKREVRKESGIKQAIVKYTKFIEINKKLLLVSDKKELLNKKLKKVKYAI